MLGCLLLIRPCANEVEYLLYSRRFESAPWRLLSQAFLTNLHWPVCLLERSVFRRNREAFQITENLIQPAGWNRRPALMASAYSQEFRDRVIDVAENGG
jgi:hypothetical protein